MIEVVMPFAVCLLKIRRLQDENCPAHLLVDLAVGRDHSRLIEQNRSWLLVFPVASEVEPLRFRVGENVVISVVEIRKLYSRAYLNSQETGSEADILLRHSDQFRIDLGREDALQINDGCRRL